MKTVYFRQWNAITDVPMGVFDERKAKQRHDGGQTYGFAVSDEHGRLTALVAFGSFGCAVDFVDSLKRTYLRYNFRPIGDKRMFLSHMTHCRFRESDPVPYEATMFHFDEDGKHEVEIDNKNEEFLKTTSYFASVESHYEPYPEFGQFDGILRVERE